jgi:hypothetical protein
VDYAEDPPCYIDRENIYWNVKHCHGKEDHKTSNLMATFYLMHLLYLKFNDFQHICNHPEVCETAGCEWYEQCYKKNTSNIEPYIIGFNSEYYYNKTGFCRMILITCFFYNIIKKLFTS